MKDQKTEVERQPIEKQPYHKRLSYEQIRFTSIGGTVEFKPFPNGGYTAVFELAKSYPCSASGKDLEQAGKALVARLRELANAVEADVTAFVERNK